LILSNVLAADGGDYTVVVTNVLGSVTSSPPATLTVGAPPIITLQPASRTNSAGTTATITVSATGTAPLSYQWQKGGVNLTNGGNVSGAATTTLTISNVRKDDEGVYRVAVGNAAGLTLGDEALLSILDPVILTQPTNQYAVAGSNAEFAVVGAGTALEYQWQLDTTNLADATNASLVISNVSRFEDGGVYRVIVSNCFGSVVSSDATLSLDWSLRFLKCFVNSEGVFQGRLVAPPGSNVIVQSWLQGSPWTAFTTNSASNGIIEFTDPMLSPDTEGVYFPVSTNRFYRALLAP
jgi:hypothetical protein